jgi:hypothetical protein
MKTTILKPETETKDETQMGRAMGKGAPAGDVQLHGALMRNNGLGGIRLTRMW